MIEVSGLVLIIAGLLVVLAVALGAFALGVAAGAVLERRAWQRWGQGGT